MSDPIVITTQARGEQEPIEFRLDDDKYSFQPPPTLAALMVAIGDKDNIEATRILLNGWLLAGLAPNEQAKLKGRLSDPGDPLDLPDLIDLIEGLVEAVTGRPTLSPSD